MSYWKWDVKEKAWGYHMSNSLSFIFLVMSSKTSLPESKTSIMNRRMFPIMEERPLFIQYIHWMSGKTENSSWVLNFNKTYFKRRIITKKLAPNVDYLCIYRVPPSIPRGLVIFLLYLVPRMVSDILLSLNAHLVDGHVLKYIKRIKDLV